MIDDVIMRAKFAGKCTECKYRFEAGALIIFNMFRRTVKHKVCPEPDYSGTEQVDIFNMWVQRAQGANE